MLNYLIITVTVPSSIRTQVEPLTKFITDSTIMRTMALTRDPNYDKPSVI